MTEALKSFIERNISFIENKQLNWIYDIAYTNYMEDKLKPLDISALTDILSNVFDDEPIFDNDVKRVPPFYRIATHNLRHLEIPEGIEYIGESAFRNCINLDYLKLPRSLRRIRAEAFKGCDNLDKIFYDGSKTDWEHVQLDIQAFGSTRWMHQDKIVYCDDGEVKI